MCILPSVPGIASSVLCRFGLVDMNSFSLFTPQFFSTQIMAVDFTGYTNLGYHP